jgi:hypothetical protein
VASTPKRRRSRIITGRSPRQLGLLSPPTVDQYNSEASLFEDMSGGSSQGEGNQGVPINPLATPFSPKNPIFPATERSVPAAQQTQSGFAETTVPQPVSTHFNSTFKGADAATLHKILVRYASEFDANSFVESIKYQGFNRNEFIAAALLRITPHQMVRLALIGSIRGANWDKIKLSSASIDADIKKLIEDKIVVRRAKLSSDITILRCGAAIPQWTAYFMGVAGVPKKFDILACPSMLQFPAAGALPMSATVRAQHVQFSIHFSRVIGGEFSQTIYIAMVNNMLSLAEVPDQLKNVLGVSSNEEAAQVDVAAILSECIKPKGPSA